ncbi:class I SAM-dependent methyltransferase [Nanoarchaeota archaeon]
MTLKEVQNQYEGYPYPKRNPEDEKKRLLRTNFGNLDKLNGFFFKGKNIINKNFRVLDAGCGTGDSTVFIAEQLKKVGATVTAIDFSEASLDIAKERCKIRGLTNIKFIEGSLLDLPKMDLEKFDYIISSGVLHHLKDPSEGLNALKSVLKDDGFISIMIYGKYGRTTVYMTQELMKLINQNETDIQKKIDNTKSIISSYGKKHWNTMNFLKDDKSMGDIGVYDLYLHSQDRAFSVKEFYDWVEGCELKLVHIYDQYNYDPKSYIKDEELLNKIKKSPVKDQMAISELINGQIAKHSFIVSKRDVIKTNYLKEDPSKYCPILFFVLGPNILEKGERLQFNYATNFEIPFTDFNKFMLKNIDGKKTIKQLLDQVKIELDMTEEDVIEFWEYLAEKLISTDYLIFKRKE